MARPAQLRLLVAATAAWLVWAVWWFFTAPGPFTVSVVDERGDPVEEATLVVSGSPQGTTGPAGLVDVDVRLGEVVVEGDGVSPAPPEVVPAGEDGYVVRVRSWTARGVVTDPAGDPIPGAVVSSGAASSTTGEDGGFLLRRARPGDLRVWRPGWEPVETSWDGSPGAQSLTMAPKAVRAVHVGGTAAERWDEILAVVEETELNGIVLDLKDESGTVWYDSDVDLAAGSVSPAFDLPAVAARLEEAGIYLIGRIVTFQDPLLGTARPDLAVTDSATGGPFTRDGQTFLDPTDPAARAYVLDLAEEACRAGVDEIQFDYIRYPDGFGSAVFDGGSDPVTRMEAIESFLLEAGKRLHPRRCAVAADVFGFTTTAIDDGGIGQHWETVASAVDVISPMLYPSHYDPGWYGFARPLDHPGELVDRALADGLGRIGPAPVVRPWLQDFGYPPADVRAEIDASERHGQGWMLWNAASNITVDALGPPR